MLAFYTGADPPHFMEIGQIFHNKYIFNNKKTFQAEILLHFQYNKDINLHEVIHQFARLHLRGMEWANILSE